MHLRKNVVWLSLVLLVIVTFGGLFFLADHLGNYSDTVLGTRRVRTHFRKPTNTPKPTKTPIPTQTPTATPTPPAGGPSPTTKPLPTQIPVIGQLKVMKDVGEPFLDHFGLTGNDFQRLKDMGVNLIETPFDICAYDEDVRFLLDTSASYGIKVIMPAGAGEAEWGYECDKAVPKTQAPVWQKDKVTAWVQKWKSHPAIYAWDTANEGGQNFPNGNNKAMLLTLAQLQTAYADVKAADPNRPVIIRLNGWVFYENTSNFFINENRYGTGVADIVMINSYSNVEDYFSDFVTTVNTRAYTAITALTPSVQFIIALGAWTEPPLWYTPSIDHLKADIAAAQKAIPNMLGLAFFKYGASGGEWYLPSSTKGAPQLIPVMTSY